MSESEGRPGGADQHAVPSQHALVRTFGWLDRFGVERGADIYIADGPEQRILVYAPPEDGGRRLLATMTGDGKFYRLSREKAAAYGLDTHAAWNDLYEMCRDVRAFYPPEQA